MKWVQWTLLGPFFRRHVRRCALLCVVGILSSVSTILLPVSLGKYYALVFDFAGNRSALFDALPAYFYDTVAHFLLFFLGLILINFLANFAKRYLITSSSELLIYELRNRLFLHQLRLETRIYEDKGIGKYLLRYSGDLKSIQNYVSKGIIEFASDILIIALFLIVLGLISLASL